MKKLFAIWFTISLLPLLPCGCQHLKLHQAQEEFDREHAENCRKEHSEHVTEQQQAVPHMQERLSSATQAQWRWIYDCDACDESLIPGDVKISREELDATIALLRQAKPMPPLPQEAFMSEAPHVALAPNGEVLRPIIIKPWMGCCGGVTPMLIFQDSNGDECYYWNFSMATPASRVQEHLQKKDIMSHPKMQLPDAAYESLRNLPTAIQVRKTDEAFQQKLKHQD